MNIIGLTGLVKIELPSHTILLCDGDFFNYAGDTYRSKDAIFGTIQGFESVEESVGDVVPAIIITLLPPTTSAVADISQPGNQTARVTFMVAEYDVDTRVISSADVMFLGQVDQTVFTLGKATRKLTMSVVSVAERLFEGNIGNSLDSEFHKSVWPGETGHDNATGLSVSVAWGTENPNDTTTTASTVTSTKKKKNKAA